VLGGAQHHLRRPLGPGEVDQVGRDIGADHLVVGAVEVAQQRPLAVEPRRWLLVQAVVGTDVYADQVATSSPRDARCSADEGLAAGGTGEGDHHPLAGLPGVIDPVAVLVGDEGVVDLVSQPQQGQLAKRGEVSDPEVVAERVADLVGGVDVPVVHAPAECFGGHVDQLHLVGGADDPVGHGLALGGPGDALDDVVERLEVLHVDGGHHVDPRRQQLLDVLPPLLVAGARHVGVGQLVDEGDVGVARQHRVEVHLREALAPVDDLAPRDQGEAVELGRGVRPAVGLHERHHHIGAAVGSSVTLAQHGVGLAHPGCGPEVDAEVASAGASFAWVLRPSSHGRSVRRWGIGRP